MLKQIKVFNNTNQGIKILQKTNWNKKKKIVKINDNSISEGLLKEKYDNFAFNKSRN